MKKTKPAGARKRARQPHPSAAPTPAPASDVDASVSERPATPRPPRLLWGVDADAVATLCSLRLELSSRLFRPVKPGSAPFAAHDAIADTTLVHRLTALTPEVALHWPDDGFDDPESLAAHAVDAGIRIGTVFPDVAGRAGRPLPLCGPDPERAQQALVMLRRAAAVAAGVGARRFTLRWHDTAPYPGAAEAARQKQRITDVLIGLRRHLPAETTLVVEYGVAEASPVRRPGPDWQTANALAVGAGQGIKIRLDLSTTDSDADLSLTTLRSADRLAGVRLEGVAGPGQRFALFLAMLDAIDGGLLVRGRRCPLPFLLDLPPGQPPGMESALRAVQAVLEAAAKAMLLDRTAWRAAQAAGDLAAVNTVLLDAYEADAGPLLTAVRAALGVPGDPLAAYQEMCRETHRAVERQRSALRAALRRAAKDAIAAGAWSAGGPDTRVLDGSGGRVIAGSRRPFRDHGLRGVG